MLDQLVATPGWSPSDKEVDTEVQLLLARFPKLPELLFYEEDVPQNGQAPEAAFRFSWEVSDSVVRLRKRIFEALSPVAPVVMMGQTTFAPMQKFNEIRPRWQFIAGVSPQIARKCSFQYVENFRVKKSAWTGAAPFVLHTGPGGVESPFLAEEHVFCGEDRGSGGYSTVTLAPDRSEVLPLDASLDELSREAALRAVWHAMQGCEQLHRAGFIHGDVKPQNIFVTGDESGQLFDFDYAVPIQSSRAKGGGTPGYLDEPNHGDGSDHHHFHEHNGGDIQAHLPARDIFAFGVSLGTVLSGKINWPSKISYQRSLKEVAEQTLSPDSYRDLILDMTRLKRSERVSLPEAINRLGRLIGLGEVEF